MPVACNTSALTGQEGSIYFKPAGTKFCLLDNTDFPAGTEITVPASNDYRVGDQIVFTEEGSSSIDSALTAGTTYHIVSVSSDGTKIEVSETAGGDPITLNGDGGAEVAGVLVLGDSTGTITAGSSYVDGTYEGVSLTGGNGSGAVATITIASNEVTGVDVTTGGSGYENADTLGAAVADIGGAGSGFVLTLGADDVTTANTDTAGDANHIKVALADFAVVCQVREFSIEITREELDVTTLPCDPCSTGSGKYAAFRRTQSGYASGSGSMTVYFTDDQTSLANRLLANVMLKSQEGAEVKLYLNTECSDGSVSDSDSIYIESGISITSMSTSVNPDDATSAELSFTINNPKHILTTDVS